jgi:AcrR family transcriptional regulator
MTSSSDTHRDRIVQAAFDIVDKCGPKALNALKVGQAMGGGRTLVYYYFPTMADLMDAVVDVYVERFERALGLWEEQEDRNPSPNTAAWCRSVAGMLRRELVTDNRLLSSVESPTETPSSWVLLLERCANLVARRAEEGDAALAPMKQDGYTAEATAFAITGFAGMVRSYPEADDALAGEMLARAWRVTHAQGPRH